MCLEVVRLSKLLVSPLEALTDSRLSEPERKILLVLFSFRGRTTDVVFPGIAAIARRAGYKDKTRISKITTQLAEKGWLIKRKRGFTGCNEYQLIMPEAAEIELSNLDSQTNLVSEANLGREANSNLDSETNSNLDSEAKYKEQTIEQTIEHNSLSNNNLTIRESGWCFGDFQKQELKYHRPDLLDIADQIAEEFFYYFDGSGERLANWNSRFVKWLLDEKKGCLRDSVP